MERYYQPEIETASREQIKAWQDERLVKQVQHVWDNVPYYRKKMEEKGVTPADIKSSDDLYKLPFLTKSDLRDAYPLRAGGDAPEGLRPHPVHLWHHWQAGGGLLHSGGHRSLGGLLCPGYHGCGGHQ